MCINLIPYRHTHSYIKNHAINFSDEIDLDKELEVFSVEGVKKWWVGALGFSATNGKCSESVC